MTPPRYPDGHTILIGDHVRIEHGRTPGIVEAILVSPQDIEMFNVEHVGVMLLSPPFGRVFWALDDANDPLVFVARGLLPDSVSEL